MRKPHYWTDGQIRKLCKLYPNMENVALGKLLGRTWSAVQNRAVKLGLKKSAKFLASAVCRFQKGQKAWNEGVTGYMGANRASFKQGNRPQTWLPIGTEVIDRDGILRRKVSDTRIRRNDWRPVHALMWEAANGPVPVGNFVVFSDRNQKNIVLDNLELVDRAENMRRNTYHRYPKEIARLIQLRGALNRQINKGAHEKHSGLA